MLTLPPTAPRESPALILTSAPDADPDADADTPLPPVRPARIDTLPDAPDALSPLPSNKVPDDPPYDEPLLTSTDPLPGTASDDADDDDSLAYDTPSNDNRADDADPDPSPDPDPDEIDTDPPSTPDPAVK